MSINAAVRMYPVKLTRQLLDFFRMSFMLFSLAAILATVVLMPLNYFVSCPDPSFGGEVELTV